MMSPEYTKESYFERDISSYILAVLLFSIPILTNVFTLDIFAVQTPIGRVVLSDILMSIFVTGVLFCYSEFRISKITASVAICFIFMGIIGLVSVANGLIIGLELFPGLAVADSVRYIVYGLFIMTSVSFLIRAEFYYLFYRIWMISAGCVLLAGVGQILAINDVPLFKELFIWDNIRGGGDRIAATFRWQGPLVLFLGMTIPLMSSEVLRVSSKKQKKIVWLGLVGLSTVIILYTGSRTAFMLLPLSLAPLLILFDENKWIGTTVGIIAAFMITILAGSSGAVNRAIARWGRAITNPTSEPRFEIWYEGTIAWLSQSPIWGVGPRQLPNFTGKVAHNGYLNILFERGVFGFIILSVLIITLIRLSIYLSQQLIQNKEVLQIGLAMGILNLFIYMVTAGALYYRYTPVFLTLAVTVYDQHS